MRAWMFYGISAMLFLFLGILMYLDKPVRIKEILSLERDYVLISGNDKVLSIPLYLNVDRHEILDPLAHLGATLYSRTKDKRLDIQLERIEKGGREYYLDQLWTEWIFIYECPFGGLFFSIDDLSVEILLDSGDAYHIRLGRISIESIAEEDEHIIWNMLSAERDSMSLYPRIRMLVIGYDSLHMDILSVHAGHHMHCTFEIQGKTLRIHIPDAPMILLETPLKLVFVDGSIQIIPHFRYIVSHMKLKESGLLVSHYVLH